MGELREGDLLQGRYRVLEAIGRGGFGQTCSGEREDGERVAIKELDLKRAADLKALDLFEREAQVLARLDHPAIPRYIDAFTVDDEGRARLPALLTQVYYSGGWVHSPISRTKSMLQNLATILQEYVMNMDCPETLEALYTRGYLRERRIVDAWGRPIDFQCRGREAAIIYRLRSAGQDGALGTEDDIIVE